MTLSARQRGYLRFLGYKGSLFISDAEQAKIREEKRVKKAEENRVKREERQKRWEEWKANKWPEHRERLIAAGKTTAKATAIVAGFLGKWIGKGAKAGTAMLADSLCIEQEPPMRIWTSIDGKHTIEARLVAESETALRLQKPDGSLVDVQKSQLRPEDVSGIAGRK